MLDIQCAADAGVVINNATRSHSETWRRIDNIENYLLRCEQPFDQEKLDASGFSWSANFNYQKGRSKIEQNVLDNVSDVNNALGFIEIEFRRFEKDKDKKAIFGFLQDEFLKSKLADIISGSFIDCLEKDNSFYLWLSKIEYNTFTFGYCAVTRDMFSYLGHANHVRSIAFEDRTKITEISSWVLFDMVKADVLYKNLKDIIGQNYKNINSKYYDPAKKEAVEGEYNIAENGWIREGLEEVFKRALNDKAFEMEEDNKTEKKSVCNTWEDIQMFVDKFGLSFVINNVNNVFIAKIYYFDDDNNFIEVYTAVKSDVTNSAPLDNVGVTQYLLFKKNHGKKLQEEVINIVKDYTLNSNDNIQELRGSGKLIAEDSLRFDIKKCRVEDKLLIAGSPSIKTSSSFQGENIKLAVAGGLLIPEEGVEIVASETKFDLTPHLSSLAIDEQHFRRESQHLDPSLQDRLSSRPTKDEVRATSQEVSTQKLNRTPIKFSDYSLVFLNALKDLAIKTSLTDSNKIIKQYFYDLIKERLVEYEIKDSEIEEIVNCINRLKLSPVVGSVSALKEAMQMAGSSKYRAKLQKQFLVALGFSRQDANNYVDVEDYGNQVSMAALENVAFFTTSEIAFDPAQDHISHLNTHFAKADRVIQGISGGEDIVQGFHFLVNCLMNTEQHVAAIKSNIFFSSRYKDFKKVQDHLEQVAKKISGVIEQMKAKQAQQQQQAQQQAQQQPQVDPKVMEGIRNDRIKMQDKIQRTNILTKTAMERKAQQFQQMLELRQRDSQSKAEIQKELADLKKQLEITKASTKIASQQPITQPQQPQQIQQNAFAA